LSSQSGDIGTYTLPVAGTWLFMYSMQFSCVGGTCTHYRTYLYSSVATYGYGNFEITGPALSGNLGSNGSTVIVAPNNSTTVTIKYEHTFTGNMQVSASTNSGSSFIQYTRIA